jgi:hypothetical protein
MACIRGQSYWQLSLRTDWVPRTWALPGPCFLFSLIHRAPQDGSLAKLISLCVNKPLHGPAKAQVRGTPCIRILPGAAYGHRQVLPALQGFGHKALPTCSIQPTHGQISAKSDIITAINAKGLLDMRKFACISLVEVRNG